MNAKRFLIFLFLGLLLGGCATSRYSLKDGGYIDVDPSYNRVEFYNYTEYAVKLSGDIEAWLLPGQKGEVSNMCYGRFNGVADAYRVIGKKNGENVYEFYGQSRYYFSIDGKNFVYKGDSVDALVTFNDFYKQRGSHIYMLGRINACGVGPSITLKLSPILSLP